jgi:hypothetical protein
MTTSLTAVDVWNGVKAAGPKEHSVPEEAVFAWVPWLMAVSRRMSARDNVSGPPKRARDVSDDARYSLAGGSHQEELAIFDGARRRRCSRRVRLDVG